MPRVSRSREKSEGTPHRRRARRTRSKSRRHHNHPCSRSRRYNESRSRSRDSRRFNASRSRTRDRDSSVKQALGSIVARLNAIEKNTATISHTPVQRPNHESTPQLTDAIVAVNKVKSHNYYVSNFDPARLSTTLRCGVTK